MKTRITNRILITLLIAFFALEGIAQKGVEDGSKYGHGEDSIRCIKNLSLYREYARQKDYVSAKPYWKIAFNECPASNENIYIDGIKIYKYYIEKEKDKTTQSALIDTLMLIYDQRIKYFDDVANVRGRQGVDLLRYRRSEDLIYIEQAYKYLEESMKAGKTKTSNPVLATFISALITLYQNKMANENKVIEDYLEVYEIIQHKLKARPNDPNLNNLLASIDANFVSDGPSNCDILVKYFEKELEKKSENANFLSMLTSLLKARNCVESDLFFTASKKLYKLEPSSESAQNIAALAYNKNQWEEASQYYKQAIQMETDNKKKAELYFGLAAITNRMNKKSEARDYAKKSIELNPSWGEPYILIGQMYADSKDECSNLELPNSIYWVAVDKFIEAKKVDSGVTAKADKLILTYSNYFPNKETAFFHNVLSGNSFQVGCWINERTTVRFNE
ncbi:MAG: hypothetical protein JXJ22_17455 [Bacteroidales bacterium]|nr:hypothetical protein [Bacteroidales bacterium]